MSKTAAATPPAIYYLHPLLAGPLAGWDLHFGRAAALGFSHVLVAPPFAPAPHGSLLLSATHARLHPALHWHGTAEAGMAEMARQAGAHGLSLLMDVVPDRVADGSALTCEAGTPFTHAETTLDPRRFDPDGAVATAEGDEALAAFWVGRLRGWAGLGVAGVRLVDLRGVPAPVVRQIADGVASDGLLLCGWMAGAGLERLSAYAGCGLDYVFSSLPWWDGRADWYWREAAALQGIAPLIAAPEAPFGVRRGATEADAARRLVVQQTWLSIAALLGSGWMMVMGQEYGARARLDPRRDTAEVFAVLRAGGPNLGAEVRELNQARAQTPALAGNGQTRLLSGPGAAVLAVARSTAADTRLPGDVALITVAMEADRPVTQDALGMYANIGGYHVLGASVAPSVLTLSPGRYRLASLHWQPARGSGAAELAATARIAALAPRIAIEAVTPQVEGGAFHARACVGELVRVEADIICDGHDVLGARVMWQEPDDAVEEWRDVRMRPLGNDRWAAEFPLRRMGVHRFKVEAWKDVFATYRDELSKKVAAGLDVTLEVEEGRRLIDRGEAQAGKHLAQVLVVGRELLDATLERKVAVLLADDTAALMRAIDPRRFASASATLPLEAERTAARFASWYEIFPRSMSGRAGRHGTFDDVIAQLPRIAGMGFDVLYFPPIHPIGRVNRKGPNNTLTPGEDDPGSPYGIADHTATHEQLGNLADFRRLRDAALAQGLELALDFAIQCAPDHPWLREHPGWFDWRPDGSIRYAENPPKKYQDIVNVDFYTADAMDGLWQTLCEVVLFWCNEGVRIFRVDNPHTKPLPFWHWMIGEVRTRHPDVLFLAEAFTKPKMMNRLAKVGFSQSYTYFTWRNTKAELQDYLVELTTTGERDFFRPNFFVNTPDINPVFLQQAGRSGHLIRAALAATLAGLWGVYCGFELCDATPLPGREEYMDSEKYQLRVWDWDAPGNIVDEITRLNWMRRLNPSLQTHLGITFLNSNNDQVIYFEKATTDRSNVVLAAISLDPYRVQEAFFEVPLWRWNLPDHASLEVDDLVFDTQYVWNGKMQHVRLDPGGSPYAVWRVRAA